MGRKVKARKRHTQQRLFHPDGRPVRFRKDGSKDRRKGHSGRRPNGKRAGSPHTKRPKLDAKYPVHVVLRVDPEVGNLRKRLMYRAIREATIALAMRELHDQDERAFRIVHMSIQRTHIHLIVEAANEVALARGMKSFQISAAKHVNREMSRGMTSRRRGAVFPDRYHAEIIRTPRQARHALSYVLNNWRKHREDRGEAQSTWKTDPFSTGPVFLGWEVYENRETFLPVPETYEQLIVYFPKTWLMRTGWRKYGRIGFYEVPSASSSATPDRVPTH